MPHSQSLAFFMTDLLMDAEISVDTQVQLGVQPEVQPELQSAAVFARAAQRRVELGLDYAGAVTPPEAWAVLSLDAAVLVDVRTAAELKYVGRVPGALHVEWGGLAAAEAFIQALAQVVPPHQPVLLLCRSAVRSHRAAIVATAAGVTAAYNVLEGFEGDLDVQQQRGHDNGWRWHGLPCIQD